MPPSRLVQSRVSPDILKKANMIISASGLTVSDVIRALMTRIALDQEIPAILFQPNAKTLAAMEDQHAIHSK